MNGLGCGEVTSFTEHVSTCRRVKQKDKQTGPDMPLPWDRLPRSQGSEARAPGPRPPLLSGTVRPPPPGPPPVSAVFSRPGAPLPDLQADSAMEDDIDGAFSFAGVEVPSPFPAPVVTDGAFPGIPPGTTGNAMLTSSTRPRDQWTLLQPGTNVNLTSRLTSMTIDDDDHVTDDVSGNFISRGMTRNNPRLQQSADIEQWLQDVHCQTVVLPGGATPQVPPRTTSPIALGGDTSIAFGGTSVAHSAQPRAVVSSNPQNQNPRDEDIYTDNTSLGSSYSVWFDVDSDGDTPLLIAIIHKAARQAIRMIRTVPSVELLDHRNDLLQSALHLAVLTHQPKVVRALVTAGVALDTRDRRGNTALHIACCRGDLDSIAALTDPINHNEPHLRNHRPPAHHHHHLPQDMSILNYEGESCLHAAVLHGHLSVVEYLLTHAHVHCDPNLGDGKSGRAILHYAVETRDVPLVLFLVSRADVKIDARTFDGTTPLALAVGRRYMDVANLLVAAGANPDLVDLSDSDSDCECAFMEEEEDCA